MSESTKSSANVCPSCMRTNDDGMQFCMFCGAGLTPQAEKKRTQNPVAGRTCIRCGKADELNSKFCVFCSGKIVLPGEDDLDSSAVRRFTSELSRLDSGDMDKIASGEPLSAPAPKPKRSVGGPALMAAVSVIGLLLGVGAAVAVGQTEIQKAWFKIRVLLPQSVPGHLPGNSVVIYTKHKFADVLFEPVDASSFKAVKTDKEGTACVTTLEPGQEYIFKISYPGHKSIRSRKFKVNKDVTSVFGFQEPIELPRADGS